MKATEKVIQPISEVADPVRRRQYLVPVVALKPKAERRHGLNGWFTAFDTIPVLGPAHGDPEISSHAAQPHYHVDWRFMSAADRRAVRNEGGEGHEKGVVVWAYDVVRFDLQPMVYRGPASEWQGNTPDLLRIILEPLHLNSLLPVTRRCPHRRADLTHCKPDENGIVTCPMHGLRWHASTGQLAPSSQLGKALMDAEKAAAATPIQEGPADHE